MPSFWEQFKTTITSPIKRIGEWFKKPEEKPMVFEVGKGLTPLEQKAAQDKIRMMAQEAPGSKTKEPIGLFSRETIRQLTPEVVGEAGKKLITKIGKFVKESLVEFPTRTSIGFGLKAADFHEYIPGEGVVIKPGDKPVYVSPLTPNQEKLLFGTEPIRPLGMATQEFLERRGIERPTAEKLGIFGGGLALGLAVIPPAGSGARSVLVESFTKMKNAGDILRRLIQMGVPEDIAKTYGELFAKETTRAGVSKILTGLENVLKATTRRPQIIRSSVVKTPEGVKKPVTMAEVMPGTPKPPKSPTPKIVSQTPEPPKGLREKGFLTTVKRSEKTTDELKQALGKIDPFYKPVTNKNAIRMADVIIKSDPDKARDIVLDPKVPVGARKSAMAISLAKKYEAEKNWDAALEIIESYDDQLRGAGRFIQAASLWNKLSPESMIRLVERAGKKYKKEISQDIKKIILRRMTEIQKMPEGPIRDRETLEVLNYVADQFPLTFREKLDAFRYQNMLSNPRSHERNIFGNLLQTFIARPLDLIGEWSWDIIRHPFNPVARDIKLAEVPKYYQAVFKTIPDAYLAFKEGFRSGAISEKIFDVATSRGMTMVEFLRQQNLPKGLTMITRFMEAQDRFFSVLIGAGEKARLMTKGVAEEAAEVEAKNLAEKYLYRETVGITTKDQALFVRALDGLGKLALEGRNIPVIGKVWSWFVPFVRTPINIAKFGVERSLLGFIGGTHTDEQMGKALMGSIITGIGATLALQDRITFLPPIDPEAKRLFYDSGRKPLSIRIGDSWIPMWYFGPYAIALALPAAVKYYTTETKEALAEGEIEKIVKIVLGTSRIITEQTPLSGISNFMKAIEGDIDYSVPGTIARTAGQIIPFSALLGYINTILDPVYRKSKTFSENLKKQLPGMTKDLPAYEKITGEPATRNWTDFFLPYSVGMSQDEFEKLYKERIREMQMRYEEKELEKRSGAEETIKILPLSEWGKLERKRAKITPLSEFGR